MHATAPHYGTARRKKHIYRLTQHYRGPTEPCDESFSHPPCVPRAVEHVYSHRGAICSGLPGSRSHSGTAAPASASVSPAANNSTGTATATDPRSPLASQKGSGHGCSGERDTSPWCARAALLGPRHALHGAHIGEAHRQGVAEGRGASSCLEGGIRLPHSWGTTRT